MKKIPFILVGAGNFALQRLKILNETGKFIAVAIVDIDLKKAKKKIVDYDKSLANKVYKNISSAIKDVKAEACFIFARTSAHTELSIEALECGLHVYCVKSISLNSNEFKKFYKIKKKYKNLVFLQGYNNQWNEAALKMREMVKKNIGNILSGECHSWGRQSMPIDPPQDDVLYEGMFNHTMGCHQLSQLVSCMGEPEFLTSYSLHRKDTELNWKGVFGTTGAHTIFEYKNSVPFSYTGMRAGHGNPYGFASRWSGNWMFHGTEGDLKRVGGRITLYKEGNIKKDVFCKDLSDGLIEDELFQINIFYKDIIEKNFNSETQKNSIIIWCLMEACNLSAIKKEKIDFKKFKQDLLLS